MTDVFLTSDLHLGHVKVSQIRGFDSVAEHDRAILKALSKIPATSVLWLLGDVAMGGWKDTIRPLAQLECDVHVVLGNHDRPHPSMSNSHSHIKDFTLLGGFMTVQTMATINHGGITYLMSHYPYEGDHGPDRDIPFRLRDEDIPLLHGHTHSSEKVSFTSKGTKQIHVGLDAWNLKPVRLADALSV